FAEMLKRAKLTVANGLDHGHFPFPRQVSELGIVRSMAHSPVFQTSFVMQSFWRPEVAQTLQQQLDGVSIAPGPNPEGEIELRLEIIEQSNEILVNLVYNTDLFDRDTIARIAEHFGNVAKAVCHNPNQSIRNLELLSADERRKLLDQWSVCPGGELIP